MTDVDVNMQDAFFSPNGLLSEASFVPNGLLNADFVEEVSQAPEDCLIDDSQMTAVEEPFVSNGLLSNDINSQTLGEEASLPNPSQLLSLFSKDTHFPTNSTSTAGSSNSVTAIPSTSYSLPLPPLKATNFDGKPVFFMRKRRIPKAKPWAENSIKPSNMLEIPIHRLMEQMSSITAAKLTTQNVESRIQQSRRTEAPEERLWVDRYRPQRFVDLLGDERVHRETLAWVKEWDYCVFGKKRPVGKQRGTDKQDEVEDEYRRPKEKILLLSGPPGLGKTTLAHVVATQAGYEVLEINASDARSAQVVEDRIRPVLESGSIVGSKKPVLLVVDEIDGATGGGDNTSGFVQKLLQLTFDKPKAKAKGRNKKEQSRPLLRPIIAICNDLYASSLSRLRQHARIIRFNKPPDVRLVKRLREICEMESLQADSRALTTLVGLAQGDMRGCLNTLQFVKSKARTITEPLIRSATVGMKEADTSVSSVLNDLFVPLSKRRVLELGMTEAQEVRYVGRLARDLDASGALDKVAIGCFEHFLTVNTHEPTLERYEKAYQWLACYDMFSGTMRSERDYGLLPYLSFSLTPFYSLFAEKGGSRVERPKADWEHFNLTKNNEEIANALVKAITGVNTTSGGQLGYRYLTMGPILSLELLPYLNRIISPPLRPESLYFNTIQIVKPEEKAVLKRLVDIMVALELRFVQERTDDGSLVYRLEPPIDVFITYDHKRAADVPMSRYAVRKMVAAEIDMALIAKQAGIVEKGSMSRVDFFRNKRKETQEEANIPSVEKSTMPRNRMLPEQNIDLADKPPTDFFGRPMIVPEPMSTSQVSQQPQPKKNCKVVYRYKEGNSSAVRRPVKIETFICP